MQRNQIWHRPFYRVYDADVHLSQRKWVYLLGAAAIQITMFFVLLAPESFADLIIGGQTQFAFMIEGYLFSAILLLMGIWLGDQEEGPIQGILSFFLTALILVEVPLSFIYAINLIGQFEIGN